MLGRHAAVRGVVALITMASTGCLGARITASNTTGAEGGSEGDRSTASTTRGASSDAADGKPDGSRGAPETGADDWPEPSDDEGCAFLHGCGDPGGVSDIECDTYAQDCPLGERCVPWSNDGSGVANGTRCAPVADPPSAVGDACTAEGASLSGIDDCDVGSTCWYIDENLQGVCVELCRGSPSEPSCAAATCRVGPDGVASLCIDGCDPLADEPPCPDGMACMLGLAGDFFCRPQVVTEPTAGQPCAYSEGCDAATECVREDRLRECEGDSCCAVLCDRRAPSCPTGHECTAASELVGFEHVGVCTWPR